MKKITDKTEGLKELLTKIDGFSASEAQKEIKKFLSSISPNELMMAERELIESGVTPETLHHLCPAHMEIVQEQLKNTASDLPADHPINTFMSEHRMILGFLDELETVNNKVQRFRDIEDITDKDIDMLKHIASHLEAAEKHHQREEEVLFPEIEKRGIYGPTEIMKVEHVGLRTKKKALTKLANAKIEKLIEFKASLDETAKFLIFSLRDHIFKENNILYPSALEVIQNTETWENIRKACDKIGYCCFTPVNQIILDLRPLPPPQRHQRIFETWDMLQAGESMMIINDHDPKPLYYQFEAEYKNLFDWKYTEKGLEKWAVIISKK